MRLFTSIRPGADQLEHLASALGMLGLAELAGPGVRVVPSESRHITLGFHSEVPDGAVDDYVAALQESLDYAAAQPFELALGGAGTFRDQTLWIGVREGAEVIRELVQVVAAAAASVGFPMDLRERFRPHLTVARASVARKSRGARRTKAPEPGILTDWAAALVIYAGPSAICDRIFVTESLLGQGPGGGPLHLPVATLALGRQRCH